MRLALDDSLLKVSSRETDKNKGRGISNVLSRIISLLKKDSGRV